MKTSLLSAGVALATCAAGLLIPYGGASAAPGTTAAPRASDVTTPSDVREVSPDAKYSTKQLGQLGAQSRKRSSLAAAATPAVGTQRQWVGLDDANGVLYRKDYTLRGVGDKIEVWVANDTAFLPADCRNQVANSTTITDAQVARLITEFDGNMYPKETAAFSTPPDRDGSNALLGPDKNGNGGNYTGDGDKTVALIDNVRDDNYYDFPAASTYIAGFFSAQFNELLDRNVMTIDAYDWAHRTGDNPADAATADPCTSRPARPNLYEGTFAHEWQHLLHYYTDPFETNWINEGLSDFAQTLVGYVDATRTIDQPRNDSHINCFQGWGNVQTQYNPNPRDCGGAQNSLTLWGEDPNPAAVLADYGNAYSMMLYLYDRFGTDFMSALHRDGERQGIASLAAELADEGIDDPYTLIHQYQSMVLLDRIVGDAKHAIVVGARKDKVTTPSLRSTVNLDNPESYDTPGAAPNGADYVALRGADGKVLKGNKLRSLTFDGAATLPEQPLEWTVVSNDPDRAGNPVLWSGNDTNLDAAAVTQVAVPTTNPTLTFLAKYGAELGYDYGYVQVSTDGGKTYTSIAGDKTVDGPFGPALNGTTDGFEPHSFDLSAYAGKTILLSFRYVSDGGVNEGGLEIDDVAVGGTTISDGSSLAPFKSPTQIRPAEVANWNLKLVGIREGKVPAVLQVEFDGRNHVSLSRHQLAAGAPFDKVVAIVATDDPTELVQQFAPYTLKVNGVTQPGGGS
ncbi:peptidase M6 immune inhibitor A [Nocardioides sp. MAH-18]|uniref:Peptidase M6 immune inhibitor A n=1 Tax=Nocardioides agri TaxID=2682843 RepID=A0A6L6XMC4_9ACTN|nr:MULTISPECIES: choice-of-anchor J domain-containing protein [unclassified Nocardioides]MBA2956571.1 immune inhibitor A [Nocardioides sp. CGMCC 1.13656]MVQ47716.1 peptidase M6 immune inhibitor A [Nocardioides sp. MAH-18]